MSAGAALGARAVDPSVLRCPSWCALDPGHVAAELAGHAGAVLHRGAESVVVCRSAEGPAAGREAVEVRVSRRWRAAFDETSGRWVREPEPTVHLSRLPDFPLRTADSLALAVALATLGAPEPRRAERS